MNKTIFFSTLQGKRESNEDHHFICLNKEKKNDKYAPVDSIGIFDGHGGSKVSEYISHEFPKYIMNKNLKYPWSKKQIISVCDKIQEKVKQFNYSYGCGSTALIIAIFEIGKNKIVNIMNTGDCRAVFCNSCNIATQLTKDHSPGSFNEKNRIESLGGKVWDDKGTYRVNNLSVSRSFGDYDTFPFVTHRPDLYAYSINENRFMIIACDGLWESLSNDDAVEFVLNRCYFIKDGKTKKKENFDFNIAVELGNHAIKEGSGDNISVIVIFFQ
jgi:protein phosphatase 1L